MHPTTLNQIHGLCFYYIFSPKYINTTYSFCIQSYLHVCDFRADHLVTNLGAVPRKTISPALNILKLFIVLCLRVRLCEFSSCELACLLVSFLFRLRLGSIQTFCVEQASLQLIDLPLPPKFCD